MSGEVYLPGSKIPFKPLNPWGRPMPKPSRPMASKKLARYQVHVETRDGQVIPVGPSATQQFAEMLCEAIGRQIGQGKEKTWSNPHIVETVETVPLKS